MTFFTTVAEVLAVEGAVPSASRPLTSIPFFWKSYTLLPLIVPVAPLMYRTPRPCWVPSNGFSPIWWTLLLAY